MRNVSNEELIKSLLKKIWNDHRVVTSLLLTTLILLPSMIWMYDLYVSRSYVWLAIDIFSLALFNGLVAVIPLVLLMKRRALLHSIWWTLVAIFSLPITVGMSTALFSHYALNVKDIQSKPVVLGLTAVLLIVLILWIIAVIALPLIEAVVVGGNHVITVIGEFATSVGTTLSVLDPQSSIAGTLIGSGLTLIAVGLQTYYAERQKKCS